MSLSEFSDCYVSQRIKGHQTKRYFPAYNYTFCIGQVDLWQKLNGPSLSWVSPVVVRVDETRPSPELLIVLRDWDLFFWQPVHIWIKISTYPECSLSARSGEIF